MTDSGPERSRGRQPRVAPIAHARFGRPDVGMVTGWLLRTSRMLSQDDRLRVGSEFAARFRGGCWHQPMDSSRISRYERHVLPVTYLVVRRYEQLLDLPTGSLVSAIDSLHRYFASELDSRPGLARPSGPLDTAQHERLAGVVERVHTDDVVSGAEWDEFTGIVSATPHVILARPTTAAEISQRLLSEMVIADGLPWMQRFESFNRLMSHPVFEQAAVSACASLARDRSGQVFIESVSTLDASNHADAASHVVDQLRDPTNDRAFAGALMACVRKSEYGHFSRAQLPGLVSMLVEIQADPSMDQSTWQLAVQILKNLRKHPGSRLFVENVHIRPRSDAPTPGALMLRDLDAEEALVTMVQHEIDRSGVTLHDPTLPALIRTAIFDPVPDVRLYTAMLLRASAYRAAIAKALQGELARLRFRGAHTMVHSVLQAVRILGGRQEAPLLQQMVLDDTARPTLRRSAAYALGHVDIASADVFWQNALELHTVGWQRRQDEDSANILRGLVYSLGVNGDRGRLEALGSTERTPRPARDAARWWLNLPTRAHESARL